MRAAILGVGSLGTIMGAFVSKNGGSCTLIDANREHVDALNKNGATISGFVDLKNVPVTAITPDEMAGQYDLVVVLLKQLMNPVALPGLLGHLGPDSVVCTLQNGIPEENVARIVGAERTIGGTVGWGGIWLGPGKSELCNSPDGMHVQIGSMTGEITENVRKAQRFLELACKVEVHTNLMGIRWSKLMFNAGMSGISAAHGCTFGDIVDHDTLCTCAAHVFRECAEIAQAKGVKLEQIAEGMDLNEFRFAGGSGLAKAKKMLRDFYQVNFRNQTASMLQDMQKNRPCEIDYINGVVRDEGEKLGIPTPFSSKVIEIVKGFEAGERPFPTLANQALFSDLAAAAVSL